MTSTTTRPAQRGDEEQLYRRHAATLIAATARSVRASHALIEDACSLAWEQPLRHQPERMHLEGGCARWPPIGCSSCSTPTGA